MDIVDLDEMGLIDSSTEFVTSIADSAQIVYSQNGSISINSDDLTSFGERVTYVTIPNIVQIVQDVNSQNMGYLINNNEIPIVNRSIVVSHDSFVEQGESITQDGLTERLHKQLSQLLEAPTIIVSDANEKVPSENVPKHASPFVEDQPEEIIHSNNDQHDDDTSKQEDNLFCEPCNLKFPSWKLYKKHKWKHINDKPFKCNECQEAFNYEMNLNLHLATHNIDNPFCPVCKKKFGRIAGLKAHIMLHEREESLFCNECGEEFNSHVYLQKHMVEHQPGSNQRYRPVEVKKTFACSHCEHVFETVAQRKGHMIKMHKVLENRRLKKFKRRRLNNECDYCHKCFEKPSQLLRHKRIHTGERPYECELCARAFSQKGSLQIHMLKHTRERPYVCEYCQGTFSQKGNLQAHIKRLHLASEGDERNYKCHLCSCIFRKPGSLNAHFTKAHSVYNTTYQKVSKNENIESNGEPLRIDSSSDSSNKENENAKKAKEGPGLVTITNYLKDGTIEQHTAYQRKLRSLLCSYCSKEFRRPGDLVRHVRTHTQEKPFKCKICCKSFALQSTLSMHVQTHTGRKKYYCPTCNKCYTTSRSLKHHRKKNICDGESSQAENIKEAEVQEIIVDSDLLRQEVQTVVGYRQVDIIDDNIILTENGNIVDMTSDGDEECRKDENTIYKCFDCNMLFKKQAHLNTHMQTHGLSYYSCEHCPCTFNSKNTLKAHLRQHALVKHKCSVCEKEFPSESILKLHSEVHAKEKSSALSTPSSIQALIYVKNGKPTKLLVPQAVEQDENTPLTEGSSLSGVMSTENGDASTDLRDLIPSLQPNQIYFIANAEDLSLSTISPKTSSQEPQIEGFTLYDERNIVTNTMTPTIPEKQMFDNSLDNCIFTLQSGVDINTPVISTDISNILPQNQILNRCDECNLVFTNDADFSVHKAAHNQQKSLTCDTCDQNFESAVECEEHSKIHYMIEEYIQCSSCRMEFQNEEEFQIHCEKYHLLTKSTTEKKKPRSNWRPPARRLTDEETKVLSAIEPDSATISEKVLLQSLLEKERYDHPVKEEPKPQKVHRHKCKYCTKSFRKPSDLIRHLRTHTGERPYQCTSCNKRFSIKSTASSHMKTHTKDRTFECYICSKHFATTGSLKIHMRLHTGLKPFACTLCGAKFRTSGHKKAHLQKHMKENYESDDSKGKKSDSNISDPFMESESSTKESCQDSTSVMGESHFLVPPNDSLEGLVVNTNEEYLSLKIPESEGGKDSLNKTQKFFLNLNDEGGGNGETPRYFFSIKDGGAGDDSFILEDQIVVTIAKDDSALPQRTNQEDTCTPNSGGSGESFSGKKTFFKKTTLDKHFKKNDQELFGCTVCLEKFERKQDLDLHSLAHELDHDFTCTECTESFTLEEELRAHKCVKTATLDLLDHDLFLFPHV